MISYVYVDRSGHKKARPVKNRKEYLAIRNTEANAKNYAAARAGDKSAKARLKQFNYNDLLPNGVLKGCCHTASTFAHDIDCGDEQECKAIAARLLEKKDEIQLLELSVSSGWGLHAVCMRQPHRTILESQVHISMVTQTEMDTSAHDQQRILYTGPATADVLLYLDDAIFSEPMTEEQSAEEYTALKDRERRGEEQVPAGAKKANKHYRPWEESTDVYAREGRDRGQGPVTKSCDRYQSPVTADQSPVTGGKSFKGIPYANIIEEWWRQNGGEPQEGERNVKLYQLAVSLRSICDNSKRLLMEIMPRYNLEDVELERIVDSACKEPPKGVSKAMNAVLYALDENVVDQKDTTYEPLEEIDQWLMEWGERFECMFDDYPLLRDICQGLKRNQYPAAIFVGGGLAMTLMTRCSYSFYHRPQELRRLNNSTLIIGDPASGKSFATRLYDLLAAPIEEADQVGKDAINAYREEMRTKGANKEKPKKPKVVVRAHPARTSNAQFIQDMVNAVEEVDGQKIQLHMLTFDTELDNTLSIQKGGSWIDKMSLELKAFHNEIDGQAYSNNDSVIQTFKVTWNYIYTGTPIALKKKVNEQNFGSGLATRLTCIPLPATNFEMMSREEKVDYESDNRLREWAVRLDKTKGVLKLDKIVDELYDWTARRNADAKEDNSHADEMLLKRCAYHGINFAAPFIMMRHWDQMHKDGEYWCGEFETDEKDWQLAELLVNVQYACQRYFFGGLAQKYFDDKKRDASYNIRRKSKSFDGFNRLPEEFTTDDVMRCFNLNNNGAAKSRVKRLIKDHLVEKKGDYVDNGTTKAIYKKTGTML